MARVTSKNKEAQKEESSKATRGWLVEAGKLFLAAIVGAVVAMALEGFVIARAIRLMDDSYKTEFQKYSKLMDDKLRELDATVARLEHKADAASQSANDARVIAEEAINKAENVVARIDITVAQYMQQKMSAIARQVTTNRDFQRSVSNALGSKVDSLSNRMQANHRTIVAVSERVKHLESDRNNMADQLKIALEGAENSRAAVMWTKFIYQKTTIDRLRENPVRFIGALYSGSQDALKDLSK